MLLLLETRRNGLQSMTMVPPDKSPLGKRELFLRGMRDFFKVSDKEILIEVAKYIREGGVMVYTSNKKGPIAFAIIHWPKNPLEVPQIVHFYSEGSRKEKIGRASCRERV